MQRERTKIELLAPARDLETGRAAVDCGADAIYIGGPGFGARHAAGNSVEDIAALVRYARPFGVRVYATLNTLLFDSELADAERIARELIAAGVDALIVQDMAFLRMGLTGVEFHASTQTAASTPEEVAFLGSAGFSRVILERALSLDEIRAIRAAATADAATAATTSVAPVELEVFVHGAICVGYSGRCFLSRASDSARSGNRGNCSQPCRLAYDLVSYPAANSPAAEGDTIIKGKHLLSVCDMDLSAHIGELLDAGVSSFKIEGRLKDATYVRNIVSHYRALIDRELVLRPAFRRASVGTSEPDFTPSPEKSFTRGASDYFFDGRGADGRFSARVASFDTPKSIGEHIGNVEKTGCDRTGNRWFTLGTGSDRGTGSNDDRHSETDSANSLDLSAGDGICFLAGGELQGTNINRVEGNRIYPNRMDGIAAGTVIYRNYDHTFTRAVERSRTRRTIGVLAQVEMSASRISVRFTDETGIGVTVTREGWFDEAQNSEKMAVTLREALSKSGGTIFSVDGVHIADGIRFIPVSLLGDIRREGLQRLLQAREQLTPARHPAAEDMSAKFPRAKLTAAENVTNRLSERFYRDHGVTEIAPALELWPSLSGEVVMRTRYCIRRETGRCLRDKFASASDKPNPQNSTPLSTISGTSAAPLYLERGTTRLRLDFDCANCEMIITKL